MGGTTMSMVAASPLRVLLATACVALMVWMSVDVWRNRAYRTSDKVRWQLVIGGISVGPVLRISDSFFVMVPLGAVYYLFYAECGPVRRRRSTSQDGSQTPTAGSIL